MGEITRPSYFQGINQLYSVFKRRHNMNRVIIITGANNGIGLAMTKALLEMGDRVAALDLSDENLTPLNRDSSLLPFRCDVSDPARVRAVVDEIVQRWGRVDILINNAALALFKPFLERTIDDIRHEFEVNYFGYLNMISAVLPIMRRQKEGVIHNLSSGVGYTGMPNMTGYTSTKGAIESLTHTLALEFADEGIVFNIVHPPLTRTKSASGLGVPPEIMADPDVVGRKLAKKVGWTKPFIAPDFSTALGLHINRCFPVGMGRLLASMTKRAKKDRNV